MLNKCPCLNCYIRHYGCHSECPAYLEFNKKNKQLREQRMSYNNYCGYIADSITRSKKKNRW